MIRLQGLLLVLLACLNPVAGQDQEGFNMAFTYGFFDDSLPVSDPTEAEVSALVCQTQVFLAQVLQDTTGNPTVTMEARDIDYIRGMGVNNTQFSMTFWGNFSTAPGGSLPTNAEVERAFDQNNNPNFDATAYIENYIWNSGAYWLDVDRMSFNGSYGAIRSGRLAEAICEPTIAPTFEPTNVTGNETTMSPDANGTAPTPAPTAMPSVPTFETTNVTGNETTMAPSPDGTGNETTVSPDANGTAPTPAPTAMASAPNTEDLVYFILEYEIEEGKDRDPTEAEIVDLLCRTNLFFRDHMRNDTGDDTIQSEATNIDWTYTPGIELSVKVMFTANVTTGDMGEMVPLETVFESMEVTTPEIEGYIQFYVWTTEPESVFQSTIAVNFTNEANIPIPVGRLDTITCPITMAPSSMPTLSPAPSGSASPSSSPSVSAAPSLSSAPSLAPSISAAPTGIPTANPTSGALPTSGGGDRPIPSEPTISPQPTVSASPTNSPTMSAAPTITPVPTQPLGPARRQNITVQFVVSNEDDITDPVEVENRGLSVSWPPFTEDLVANVTEERNRRRLRAGGRRLAVGYEPGSSSIDQVVLTPCPRGSKVNVICHNTTASYILLLRGDEDAGAVEQEFGTATIEAIDDGRYQAVLDQEDPSSPLTIGIIRDTDIEDKEDKDDDDGMPIWLIILIVLLCVLCCLCMLAALFYLMQDRDSGDKQLEPYDEEGFVYDFLIPPNEKPQTEVDDDAATKAVELEEEGEDEEDDQFDDEDEDALEKVAEPVAVVEAEDFDDEDEEEEREEGDDQEEEDDDDEAEERNIEEEDSDDEGPQLVPVDDVEEAENIEDSEGADEESDHKPDPDEEFGDQDEPEGVRASTRDAGELEEVDGDSAEGEKEEEEGWDDEAETEPESTQDEGGEEAWDDDGEDGGDGEEEWDDDQGNQEEEWEEDGAGEAEEGWDDEDEKAAK